MPAMFRRVVNRTALVLLFSCARSKVLLSVVKLQVRVKLNVELFKDGGSLAML